jgi:hypothetical protein
MKYKKLKDKEIAIKRIKILFKKKIERTNKKFELKGKIKKNKLTNESKIKNTNFQRTQ